MPHRFLVPAAILAQSETQLPPEVARQVARVLRLRVGDEIVLFAGDGAEHPATLTEVGASVVVRLRESRYPVVELPGELHIAMAVLKGEKPEWTLQKLTEIGATRLTFLTTERTIVDAGAERWSKRLDRYQRILCEAAEQSGRVRLPTLDGPVNFPQFLNAVSAPAFLLDPLAAVSLPQAVPPKASCVTLLIGPEGGFTSEEVRQAHGAGVIGVRLGARVLRAETAALAGATLAAAAMERVLT